MTGATTSSRARRRYGLKVLHGIWVSHDADKTRQQVQTTIALAKAYPDVIKAIVVGNEVLLRGEMSAATLAAIIRDVKAAVPMPVTYADVWEFWLRYPDVQNAVDFVTVHILPYWEDFPIPASRAAEHVADIRGRVAAAFPEKEIVVGEFGWPSEGRMREGARPSPSNQALALTETLALAAREHFQLNVIEAFDQPWKRALEGTVGGYWGIIDRATGAPKFNLAGGSVSDHPNWPIQAADRNYFGGARLRGRCDGHSPQKRFRPAMGFDRRHVVCFSRRFRMDPRNGRRRKLQHRQLASLAGVCGSGGRGADCLRHRLCGRPAGTGFRRSHWRPRNTSERI